MQTAKRAMAASVAVMLLAVAVSCDSGPKGASKGPGIDSGDPTVSDGEGGNEGQGGGTGSETAQGTGTEIGQGTETGISQTTDTFNLTVEPNAQSIQENLIDKFCVGCHSGALPAGDLNLTNVALYADGAHHPPYHGRLVVPGKPEESMLRIVIKSQNPRDQMPPANSGLPRVNAHQIAAVEQWIASLEPQGPGDDEPGDGDEPGDDGEPGTDEPGGDDDGFGSDEPGGAPSGTRTSTGTGTATSVGGDDEPDA